MRERLDEYEGYHQTLGNEVCHYIGIPSIIAGSATLLGHVPLVTLGSFTLTLAADGQPLSFAFVTDTYELDFSSTSRIGARHGLSYGASLKRRLAKRPVTSPAGRCMASMDSLS